MRDETQHNEISIKPVETVSDVWVVVRLSFCEADVLHDFVFSLSWSLRCDLNVSEPDLKHTGERTYLVARQHDLDITPICVFRYLLVDEVAELL